MKKEWGREKERETKRTERDKKKLKVQSHISHKFQ